MSDIKLAFKLGVAYGLGRAHALTKNMALDADKWITVKPNGAKGKGRHVLIDDQTGEIKGGMGGEFDGQNISDIYGKAKSSKKATKSSKKVAGVSVSSRYSVKRDNPKIISYIKEQTNVDIEPYVDPEDQKSSYKGVLVQWSKMSKREQQGINGLVGSGKLSLEDNGGLGKIIHDTRKK